MFRLLLLMLLCFVWPGQALIVINGKEEPVLDRTVNDGMALLYKDEFSAAIKVFSEVRAKYPYHPIGYFLIAAALDAKMVFYYSGFLEADFMKNCEKAIEKGEEQLQKLPNDKWLLFFVGGAYGYMGTFQARYKNYISAFRNGWTGVSLLKQINANNPDFVDPLFGLGTYHYWSSRLSKALWWMPGLKDERVTGITQLERCLNRGEFTRVPAAGNLMRIFIEEKRFADAIRLAEQQLKIYQNNRIFLYNLAEAYYLSNDLNEAEKYFVQVVDLCDSEEFNNNVGSLKCHSYLAKIYEVKKLYVKALAECRRGKQYKFNETDKLLAQEFLDDINGTQNRILKIYHPSR
ncbi:MAG: hypothetical protein A2293_10990 [Elusimicrobia bacterium RIFOXYB2_FULL_49_7]|nr:MAG: hypothetical protein A2293_10990 [Elusimicrobia bacterium RIFOXYB2_FULL_49_7]